MTWYLKIIDFFCRNPNFHFIMTVSALVNSDYISCPPLGRCLRMAHWTSTLNFRHAHLMISEKALREQHQGLSDLNLMYMVPGGPWTCHSSRHLPDLESPGESVCLVLFPDLKCIEKYHYHHILMNRLSESLLMKCCLKNGTTRM